LNSHGDEVTALPERLSASQGPSKARDIAGVEDPQRRLYGLQFHPEVHNNAAWPGDSSEFLFHICHCGDGLDNGLLSLKEALCIASRKQVGVKKVCSFERRCRFFSDRAALLHKGTGNSSPAFLSTTGLLRARKRKKSCSAFSARIFTLRL